MKLIDETKDALKMVSSLNFKVLGCSVEDLSTISEDFENIPDDFEDKALFKEANDVARDWRAYKKFVFELIDDPHKSISEFI